jgi:amino acid permease
METKKLHPDTEDHTLKPQLSKRSAIMAIVKCGIGAGSFNLPRAFMDGGVYMATVITIFLGCLSAFTLLLLVESSTISSIITKVQERENRDKLKASSLNDYKLIDHLDSEGGCTSTKQKHCSTYSEMGAVAFPEYQFTYKGTKCNLAYCIISLGILATSLGVCAAYVDFIGALLPDVIRAWSKDRHIFLTRGNMPWLLMPVILGFTFLRTMKILTYTSFLGNVLVVTGCLVVVIHGIVNYHSTVTLNHSAIQWETLPRYVGGNTFVLAIHVVVLPLLTQMETEDGNKNKRDAINISYTFLTAFNAFVGAIGFLLFASSICNNDQAVAYEGDICLCMHSYIYINLYPDICMYTQIHKNIHMLDICKDLYPHMFICTNKS